MGSEKQKIQHKVSGFPGFLEASGTSRPAGPGVCHPRPYLGFSKSEPGPVRSAQLSTQHREDPLTRGLDTHSSLTPLVLDDVHADFSPCMAASSG